jgi:divalent metal cation (Fe/Co/Zn/Cd) transporter
MGKKSGRVFVIASILVAFIVFFFGAFIQEKGWLKWTGVSAGDMLLWCIIALIGFIIGCLVVFTSIRNGK